MKNMIADQAEGAQILHITHRYWPFIGGAEQFVAALAGRWTQGGGNGSVWCTDSWDLANLWKRGQRRIPLQQEKHDGVCIRRFAVRHLPFGHFEFALRRHLAGYLPQWAWKAGRALTAAAPDVPGLATALPTLDPPPALIHGWNITLDSMLWPALAYARARQIPFAITPLVHAAADRNLYLAPHQVRLLQAADVVFAVTPSEVALLEAVGVPSHRLVLAPPALDPPVHRGDAASFRNRYHITAPLVTFLGALASNKGIFQSLQAVAQLKALGEPVVLALAGPTTAEFDRRWPELQAQLAGTVLMLGYLTEEDKQDLLAASDAIILPSRTESFGLTYLEGWYYGKPVIGALTPAAIIRPEVDGLLVPFGDAGALAASLRRLLHEPELAHRLGSAGQHRVQAEFNWDRTFAVVAGQYRRLLCGTPGELGPCA
jgi:glycosyltransferase involved in cell wall biosynthesis